MSDKILELLYSMDKKLDLLHQSVHAGVFPVLQKHEKCLHGDDGQSGVIVETKENTKDIKTLYTNFKTFTDNRFKYAATIVSICGVIVAIAGLLIYK